MRHFSAILADGRHRASPVAAGIDKAVEKAPPAD
jgi:hypothetical protein